MTDPAETALRARLDALGLRYDSHEHEPAFTVAESRHLRGVIPGAHTKNLFLKDRRGGFWLVTCREDRQFRIRALEKHLRAQGHDARDFSFGKEEALRETLGVAPGSVTALALMHEGARDVRFVLDASLLGEDRVCMHPLRNTATLSMPPDGLRRFIADCGHEPIAVDFDALAP